MDYENLRRVGPGAPKPGLKFGKTEIGHIVFAVSVLSVAYALMLIRGGSRLNPDDLLNILELFLLAVVIIACSFLAHEFGHKWVAQNYGAWSEFRSYPTGLLMALVFSFFGFLFAAPGAVVIKGRITEDQMGRIAAAGPLTNFIIGAVALIVSLSVGGLTGQILGILAYINAFLGIFNMIPVPPFDGFKILHCNKKLYIAMAIAGVALLALNYVF